MNKVKVTIAIVAMAFVSLTTMAFSDLYNESRENESQTTMNAEAQQADAKQVVAEYMTIKDALVKTDKDAAAKAGKQLGSLLKNFKVSNYPSEQQKKLKDVIDDAMVHTEHIGKSEMAHQREHFKMLSKDIIDMLTITGTEITLYQQYCPMYDGGSAWLSMEKEIRNPYFGSKMMKCGKVQKEIN